MLPRVSPRCVSVLQRMLGNNSVFLLNLLSRYPTLHSEPAGGDISYNFHRNCQTGRVRLIGT